jgi:mitogen-activated protein kinase kinase kinase
MFHIGVATQHPPLPEPGQLSDLGINFIKQCLTIDPVKRPTAVELMEHPWMLEFREALIRYEEAKIPTTPPSEMPSEENFGNATVARRAAMLKKREVERIQCASPSTSALETPSPDRELSRQNSSFSIS